MIKGRFRPLKDFREEYTSMPGSSLVADGHLPSGENGASEVLALQFGAHDERLLVGGHEAGEDGADQDDVARHSHPEVCESNVVIGKPSISSLSEAFIKI